MVTLPITWPKPGSRMRFQIRFGYDQYVPNYDQIRAFDTKHESESIPNTTCEPQRIPDIMGDLGLNISHKPGVPNVPDV